MMGQSLATDAVSGGVKSASTVLAEQARPFFESGDIEGLRALRRSQFGGLVMMAEADDDKDKDEDDDDASGDDDDEDESDEDEDEDDKSKADPRIKELSDENAKWRVKFRKRGERITELEAENEKLRKGDSPKKDEDKDDTSGAAADSAIKTENEELKQRLAAQAIRQEFNDLVSGDKALAKFANPKTAFRLLDLDEVEIDEDGDITGLDVAIKALAKSDPYLLAKASKDDDDEGGPAGQPTGGRGKGKGNPNRDKLLDKYPALRR